MAITDPTVPANRLKARLSDPRRLAALEESALLDAPAPPALQELCETIRTVLDADAAAITVVDAERQIVVTAAGLPEPWASRPETDLAHCLCQHVVADGTTVAITDLDTIDLTDGSLAAELGVGAYLGIPFTGPDGAILGATSAISTAPRLWSTHDVVVLEALGRTVNSVLGSAIVADSAAIRDEVAMVAHDLRSPMSALVGAARRLTKSDLDDAARTEMSTMIDRSSLQLESMVEDLLTTARPAARDRTLAREPVDVSDLLHQLAREAVATHGVRFDVVEGPPVTIYADSRAIQRIVQNLIDNAVRHGEPPFTMGVASSGTSATLTVTNEGPPVDDEARAHLFGRFRPGTGISSRTGLGLHIVWRLTTALGGTVDVSAEDATTVFRVDLPQRS